MAHNSQEWIKEEDWEPYKEVRRMYLINSGIKDLRNIMWQLRKGLKVLAERSSHCAIYVNNLVILLKIANMVLIEFTH